MRDGSFPFGNGTGKPTLVRGHLPLKFQWITHTKRLRTINPLVVLGDNLLVEDAYLFHHQQPHLLDDVACQLLLGDVLAFYVEPEVLPLQATAVGEVHLEIELHSSVRGVFVHHRPPLSSETSYDIHSTS